MAPFAALLPLLACPDAARAAVPERLPGEHFSRTWTSEDGLPATGTGTVDQDERGFLWVGTSEGVVRLDGARMTRMTGPGTWVVRGSGAANRIVVVGETVAELGDDHRLSPIDAPLPPPYSSFDLRMDRTGRLWAARGDRVAVEDAAGAFRDVPGPWQDARLLGADATGGVFVETGGRLTAVRADGAVDLGPSVGALTAVDRGDGSVVTAVNEDPANNQGAVLAYRDGAARRLYAGAPRIVNLVADGLDLYVSTDAAVSRIDPSDALSQLTAPACCGLGLVDREGGLWFSGELGLLQVPSPRTTTWRATASIRMAPAPGGLWVSSWSGMHRYRPADGDTLRMTSWPVPGIAPCVDARGEMWSITRSSIRRFRGGEDDAPEALPGPGTSGYYTGCAVGSNGRTWFGSPFALLVSDAASPVPHAVRSPPPAVPGADAGSLTAVLEADGMVLYGVLGHLCRAPVERVLADGDAGWVCDVLDRPAQVADLEVVDGAVWASVLNVGVVQGSARARGWQLVPASAALRTGTLGMLAPSPRGGLWVASEGQVLRVEPSADVGGWRVLERIGAAQGVRADIRSVEVVETDAVWLRTVDGAITRIEPGVRAAESSGPEVFLMEATSSAGAVDVDQPLVLDAGDRLEVLFAAPVFGRRSQLAFRYRLGGDAPWSAPITDPTLRFVGLGAGAYAVEVAATLDGRHWSERPATYAFRVRAPWYARPPFLLACAAAAAGAGWSAQTLRTRAASRLERQRARIARDLHDEIGSGLGSIGILAGVAARRPADPKSAELVARIGSLVSELGVGLTDIVTSLRGGAANLRALHAHIVERGAGACASGRPRFDAEPSDSVPEVALSVPVRINVFLVAVEAIHNAVRHADATVVSVRLARDGRRGWALTVRDDGIGIGGAGGSDGGGPARVSGGVGLRSIRERADEIGAALTLSEPPGGGTVVTLRFDPTAEEAT